MQTFVVRVWTPARAEDSSAQRTAMHGLVEHAGSQRSRPFRDEAELVEFMHACLRAERHRAAPEADPAS